MQDFVVPKISNLMPKEIVYGLVVMSLLTVIFYYFQYGNFMLEVSRTGKEFHVGYDIVYSRFDTLLIEYVCTFIKFFIPAVYIARKAKNKALVNCVVFGLIGALLVMVSEYLWYEKSMTIYFFRNFSQVCCGFVVCVGIGFIRKVLLKKSTGA